MKGLPSFGLAGRRARKGIASASGAALLVAVSVLTASSSTGAVGSNGQAPGHPASPKIYCPQEWQAGNCYPVNVEFTFNLHDSKYKEFAWTVRYNTGNCTLYEAHWDQPSGLDPQPAKLLERPFFFVNGEGSCGFERSHAWFRITVYGYTSSGYEKAYDTDINVQQMNLWAKPYRVDCGGDGNLDCRGLGPGPVDRLGVPTAQVILCHPESACTLPSTEHVPVHERFNHLLGSGDSSSK